MYKHAYVSVPILGFKRKILTSGISDPGTIFDIFIFLAKAFWFFKKTAFFFKNLATVFEFLENQVSGCDYLPRNRDSPKSNKEQI